MTKIERLLAKHESIQTRYEGLFDRTKALFTDRNVLKSAKIALNSKDAVQFKNAVNEIGVERFVELYDDVLISILKKQLDLVKEIEKFQAKYAERYNKVKTLFQFNDVLVRDPVFKYFMESSADTLKRFGVVGDATIGEFVDLYTEAFKNNDPSKVVKFITDLYKTEIIGKPLYDRTPILEAINKIKSKSKMTADQLYDILTAKNSLPARDAAIKNSYVRKVIKGLSIAYMTPAYVSAGLAAISMLIARISIDAYGKDAILKMGGEQNKGILHMSLSDINKSLDDSILGAFFSTLAKAMTHPVDNLKTLKEIYDASKVVIKNAKKDI